MRSLRLEQNFPSNRAQDHEEAKSEEAKEEEKQPDNQSSEDRIIFRHTDIVQR